MLPAAQRHGKPQCPEAVKTATIFAAGESVVKVL
jgi:hypothetical protein